MCAMNQELIQMYESIFQGKVYKYYRVEVKVWAYPKQKH